VVVCGDGAESVETGHELAGVAAAADQHNAGRVVDGPCSVRAAVQPVEIELLVLPVEGVERIAHPNPSSRQSHLLRWDTVRENRSAARAPQGVVEHAFARALRERAACEAVDDQGGDNHERGPRPHGRAQSERPCGERSNEKEQPHA
jgi:hypothetical protein